VEDKCIDVFGMIACVCLCVLARKPPTPAVAPRYNPESVYGASVARKSRDNKENR